MKASSVLSISLVCLSAVLLLVSGCGTVASSGGDLDRLTKDANNNGFPEVDPPAGVSFDAVGSVNMMLKNTIDQGDVALIAQANGIDPSLLSFVALTARMELTLYYDNGITDTIKESESIAAFEKKFEVACPNSANIAVMVTANAPIAGTQNVVEFEYDITRGVEYECDQTISVETYMDANNQPQADFQVN